MNFNYVIGNKKPNKQQGLLKFDKVADSLFIKIVKGCYKEGRITKKEYEDILKKAKGVWE